MASLVILWWTHGCGKEGVTLLIMIFRKQSCDKGGVAKESEKGGVRGLLNIVLMHSLGKGSVAVLVMLVWTQNCAKGGMAFYFMKVWKYICLRRWCGSNAYYSIEA